MSEGGYRTSRFPLNNLAIAIEISIFPFILYCCTRCSVAVGERAGAEAGAGLKLEIIAEVYPF